MRSGQHPSRDRHQEQRDDHRREPEPDGRTSTSRLRTSPALLAAVGLYAAAAGHVIAALVHLSHGWSITAFFLVAAAVQVVVAGRVGRGTAAAGLVVAVLLGTLGLVLLYVASRTLNLPFGGVHTVHNDRPQDPDLLGTAVVLAELVTLATAPALLPDRCAGGRRPHDAGRGRGCGRRGPRAWCERRSQQAGPASPGPRPLGRGGCCAEPGCLVVALAVLLVSGCCRSRPSASRRTAWPRPISAGDHLLLDKRDAGHPARR